MAVPYTFATATGSIPLSQLDTNFATGIIIGNTTVTLGDTITTINNLTLANVTVTSASFSNVTLTGNTNVASTTTVFSGTGARIQGDFSNATLASRTAFQDKTTNSATAVYALPNGTSTASGWVAFANSDPTNAAYVGIDTASSLTRLVSSATGSGTALPLTFNVGAGGAEAARFTTSGAYLIGSSSSSSGYDGASWKWVGYQINSRNTTADTNQIVFYNPNGQVGFINTNGTATVYSTSSDYRLKNNPQALNGSGSFIDSLRPKSWTWVTDGSAGVGFIAHEVAPIAPSAVSGTKDAVNEDGTPKYQGIAYGSAEFIANIVAELQSLRARVAALESA